MKTVHHTAYITSTKAKLFAIRCSINQVCSKNNYFGYVVFAACLIDTASDSKKLYFSTCDICCMINYLD